MFFKKKPSKFKMGDIVYHRETLEKGKILRNDHVDPSRWVVEWGTSVKTHMSEELLNQQEYVTAELEKKEKIS